MGHHTVLFLKLLATNGAGELVSSVSIVFLHVPVERRLLTTREATDFTLQGLLSCVNHAVHSQIVGALEGTSTELTNVVPLVCVVLCVTQQLLL